MKNIKISLDKFFTILMQYFTLVMLKIWLFLFRDKTQKVQMKTPIDHSRPMIIISNHMTPLDPTTIYSAFKGKSVFNLVPVKFMTSARYYFSFLRPYLYSIGCYPHKGGKKPAIEASLDYIKDGYKIFIFPEGKLNKSYKLSQAYPGVCSILSRTDNPRIVLANIYWEKRQRIFSRPKTRIIVKDAPTNLNIKDSMKIMEEIYRIPGSLGIK